MVAIDRIEVLRDGASAVYGTDAIAGVVNFITRRNTKVSVWRGELPGAAASGGEQYSAKIVGGMGHSQRMVGTFSAA